MFKIIFNERGADHAKEFEAIVALPICWNNQNRGLTFCGHGASKKLAEREAIIAAVSYLQERGFLHTNNPRPALEASNFSILSIAVEDPMGCINKPVWTESTIRFSPRNLSTPQGENKAADLSVHPRSLLNTVLQQNGVSLGPLQQTPSFDAIQRCYNSSVNLPTNLIRKLNPSALESESVPQEIPSIKVIGVGDCAKSASLDAAYKACIMLGILPTNQRPISIQVEGI